jgi:hypothetical protein
MSRSLVPRWAPWPTTGRAADQQIVDTVSGEYFDNVTRVVSEHVRRCSLARDLLDEGHRGFDAVEPEAVRRDRDVVRRRARRDRRSGC